MFKFSVASVLLAVALCAPAMSQTNVATCPAAAAGTVWAKSAWLPCPGAVSYLPVPLQPGAIVADMRGGTVFSWMLASNVQAADGVWTKTAAVPAGIWSLAKAPDFVLATGTVTPPYTAPATLIWAAPTTNVDGTSPANVSGYNVYAGASAAALAKVASLGPTALTYQSMMGVGTMYFAVASFNANAPTPGESRSAVVSKSLAAPTSTTPNPAVLPNPPVIAAK